MSFLPATTHPQSAAERMYECPALRHVTCFLLNILQSQVRGALKDDLKVELR